MFKKIALIIACVLIGKLGWTQVLPEYSQYMFDGLVINPAYAGSKEYISFTGVIHQKWLGIKGAPSTQTFSVHAPLTNNRIAIGGTIVNNKIGVKSRQDINLVYSYRIYTPKGKLSLGILAGISNYKTDFESLELQNETDMSFQDDNKFFSIPNFGIGAYFYNKRYYIGISVPKLVTNLFINKHSEINTSVFKNHYVLTGGYMIELTQDLKLKPNGLIKFTDGQTLEFDLNSNLYIKDEFCVGLSYRSLSSLNIIFEAGISSLVRIGYSFDIPTNDFIHFGELGYGTHEISVNYILNNRKIKTINPRYF